jgi:hypothetical protein
MRISGLSRGPVPLRKAVRAALGIVVPSRSDAFPTLGTYATASGESSSARATAPHDCASVESHG